MVWGSNIKNIHLLLLLFVFHGFVNCIEKLRKISVWCGLFVLYIYSVRVFFLYFGFSFCFCDKSTNILFNLKFHIRNKAGCFLFHASCFVHAWHHPNVDSFKLCTYANANLDYNQYRFLFRDFNKTSKNISLSSFYYVIFIIVSFIPHLNGSSTFLFDTYSHVIIRRSRHMYPCYYMKIFLFKQKLNKRKREKKNCKFWPKISYPFIQSEWQSLFRIRISSHLQKIKQATTTTTKKNILIILTGNEDGKRWVSPSIKLFGNIFPFQLELKTRMKTFLFFFVLCRSYCFNTLKFIH